MNFNMIKTQQEDLGDYIVLIVSQVIPIVLFMNLLFTNEMGILKTSFVSLGCIPFIFLLYYLTNNLLKILSFKKEFKETFLSFDDNRMSSFTKDGSFSLAYKEIDNIQLKTNYLPISYMKNVSYVLQVYVEKERITWFDKVLDRNYKKYEMFITQNEYPHVLELMEKFEENKK